MYDRDLLREELDQILRDKRRSVEMLTDLLGRVADSAARTQIAEVHDHALRDVELGERLVEIVS